VAVLRTLAEQLPRLRQTVAMDAQLADWGVQLLEPGAARRGPLFPGHAPAAGGHARFGICIPRLPASFTGTGDLTAALLLANSGGYGLMAKAGDMHGRNKGGKGTGGER
jgi:hypothetical protein